MKGVKGVFTGVKFTDMSYDDSEFEVGEKIKRNLLDMNSPFVYIINFKLTNGDNLPWSYLEEDILRSHFDNGVYIKYER